MLSPISRALTMVAIDQTIGAVFITMGFYLAFAFSQTIVPGGNVRDQRSFITTASSSIQTLLWPTLLANWLVCLSSI